MLLYMCGPTHTYQSQNTGGKRVFLKIELLTIVNCPLGHASKNFGYPGSSP